MADTDRSSEDDDAQSFSEINKCLDQGENLYSTQEGKNGEYDGGRFGVRVALHAALELLEAVGATNGQLKPLNRLAAALDDLDRGTVADLLAPSRKDGRPPVIYERELLKALAVAALDLLMMDGKLEKEASELVARRLSAHGYKITVQRDANPASVVRGWRKNIDLNRVQGRRDTIIQSLDTVEGTGTAKAEKLLSQLPGIVPVKS